MIDVFSSVLSIWVRDYKEYFMSEIQLNIVSHYEGPPLFSLLKTEYSTNQCTVENNNMYI